MTTLAQVLPQHFGYVAAVASLTGPLLVWQQLMCGKARKLTNIKYPHQTGTPEEAEKDINVMKFICAQRAHGNTLESLPSFLFSLIFAGTQYPILSASLGALWIVGRVLYSRGYYTGVASKRMQGAVGHIGFLGLMITTGFASYNLIAPEFL